MPGCTGGDYAYHGQLGLILCRQHTQLIHITESIVADNDSLQTKIEWLTMMINANIYWTTYWQTSDISFSTDQIEDTVHMISTSWEVIEA
jgi:hypothetical protein